MSKINANIFLLSSINNLDNLDQITNQGYSELLKHSRKDEELVKKLPNSEKFYEYTWKNIGSIEEISVPSYVLIEDDIDTETDINMEDLAGEEDTSETIRYVKVTGDIEYSTKKRKDDNNNFLPKKDRLNNVDTDMIFFELHEQIFVLILTSNFYLLERTKKLIGIGNISDENDLYYINSDLFTWLFYVYTENKGILEEELLLENIEGFIGNVTDNANVITGTSRQTTELIVTKAFISTGEELKNVTVRVSNQDLDITCSINEKSSVIINYKESHKLRMLDTIDKKEFLLLYFYGYLILRIKQLYNCESQSFQEVDNPMFSKKIGLSVIENIILRNNISLEDVQIFFQNAEQETNIEVF